MSFLASREADFAFAVRWAKSIQVRALLTKLGTIIWRKGLKCVVDERSQLSVVFSIRTQNTMQPVVILADRTDGCRVDLYQLCTDRITLDNAYSDTAAVTSCSRQSQYVKW